MPIIFCVIFSLCIQEPRNNIIPDKACDCKMSYCHNKIIECNLASKANNTNYISLNNPMIKIKIRNNLESLLQVL